MRRSGKNRDISAAAFPDDGTWLDLNATSVIGADVKRAVKRMVEIAAPAFALEAGTSPSASAPAPVGSGAPPSGDACALLTAEEASQAIGETMSQTDGTADQCIWFGDQGSGLNLTILPAEAGDTTPMMDRRLALSPDAEQIEVAGYPALYEIGPLLGVPSVYVYPSPTTELELELVATRELDAREALMALAELAVPRFVAAGPTPTATPTASQAAAGGVCDLLTAAEVSAALGETMTSNDVGTACVYAGDVAGGSLAGMTVGVVRGTEATSAIEQMQGLGWTELTIGGMPALQAPTEELSSGLSRSMLVVMPDGETALVLSADAPAEVDVAAAVRSLAELAAPRLGSLPIPSTAPATPVATIPTPSAAARSGLAALFPAEVGGAPVTIDRQLTGREFLAQIVNFKPMEQQVTKALRRRDRTVGDLSFALGGTGSGSLIAAFQVEGGPIRPLVNTLLESLAMERTGQDVPAASVAGKEAFEVSGGFLVGSQGVAYPNGEVLWLVFSSGEEQAEIFSKLP